MSRLFLSHASADNAAAIALGRWLTEQGYGDFFLDTDPARGLSPGERWMEALKSAADRCEAVLCLVSPAWLTSRWCLAEFLLAKSLHKYIFGLIVAPVRVDQLPPEMTSEWQVCELTGSERPRAFVVDGHTITFCEAGLDRLRVGLDRAGLDARGFPWSLDRDPYRGLQALEPEDAAVFFGRDAAIIRGMDQIRGMAELIVDRLLVILGASGAGKSSFLRAGLWPRLARDDMHFLPLQVIRPETAVISGSTGLAAAVSTAFSRLGERRPPGVVKATLAANGPAGLGLILAELAAMAHAHLIRTDATARPPIVVLPLDQTEELFNPEGVAEAKTFLSLLGAALTSGQRVLAIATVRTDRYEQFQDEAPLPGVRRVLFDLPPMSTGAFREVIEGPAQRASTMGRKLVIDPELTETLMADAIGVDALPLLSFTLQRLWRDYGASGRLTLADYRAIDGVRGSIKAAVADALSNPGEPPVVPQDRAAQRAALRAAFIPWLARIDPASGVILRRAAAAAEIPSVSRGLVERFVTARLLVADRRSGLDEVEIAHEALLRQWPDLLEWLDADREQLRLLGELEQAATTWDRNKRRDDWLDHRADRLAAMEGVLRRDDFAARVGAVGMAYVRACRTLMDDERTQREYALARQARLQRRAALGLVVAFIAMILGSAVVISQRYQNIDLAGKLGHDEVNLRQQQDDIAWLKKQMNVQEHSLATATTNLMTELAATQSDRGNTDGGLRLATLATQRALEKMDVTSALSSAPAQLASALWYSDWQSVLPFSHGLLVNSADGLRYIVHENEGRACTYDALTRREIACTGTVSGRILTAAFSGGDGRILVTDDGSRGDILDIMSGDSISNLEQFSSSSDGCLYSASFSMNSDRVVATYCKSKAKIWDVRSGKLIAALTTNDNWVRLAGIYFPREVAVFGPDGRRLLAALDSNTAYIWDTEHGQIAARLIGHRAPLVGARFSSDGRFVSTRSLHGTCRIWNASTGQQLSILQGKCVTSPEFSPDDRSVVAGLEDNTIRVYNTLTGKESMVLTGHEASVGFAAFDKNGLQVVSAADDDTMRLWNINRHTPVKLNPGDRVRATDTASSPDGALVAAPASPGSQDLIVRDAVNGRVLTTLHGHGGPIASAAFSPHGSRIVTASEDRTVRVWDATNGQTMKVLRGHTGWVSSAAFSPDGARIVTASSDGTVRVWDTASGRTIAILPHDGVVRAAVFSPDGQRIVSTLTDDTTFAWDAGALTLSPLRLLSWACDHQLRGISILTRAEMDLLGYPTNTTPIDVCANRPPG